MASQRITVAKVGGRAGGLIARRLRAWSAARRSARPSLQSAELWPPLVRKQADEFAEQLRAHAFAPPVIHFVEWADLWSMGDLFSHWLSPPGGPLPLYVHADRFEVYGYELPDEGRLDRYLAGAKGQQWSESDTYIRHLRDAIDAWEALVERSVLVVLREVVGPTVSDEEVMASLSVVPAWLGALKPEPDLDDCS